MNIPFTQEQFLGVFAAYNQAVLPVLPVFYLAGIVPAVLSAAGKRLPEKVAPLLLAVLWVWMGGVYHIGFFSRINPAAYLFGTLFVLQGVLLLVRTFVRGGLPLRFRRGSRGWTGAAFILYALIAYPLIGALSGHGYPYAPLFGVAPCPTAIYTFGLLLWSERKVPIHLLVVPLLWSILGLPAALSFGILEDFALPVAGVLGTIIALRSPAVGEESCTTF